MEIAPGEPRRHGGGNDATVLVLSPNRGDDPGIVAATGPGVDGAARGSVRICDVAPTILGHLGLVDADLPGRALSFLTQRAALRPVLLRQANPTRTSPRALDPRLVAAGYRPPPPAPSAWEASRLAILALAILQRASGRAAALANEALALDPDCLAALYGVALAAVALRDPGALAGVAEAFDRVAPEKIWGSLVRATEHLLRDERAAAVAALPREVIEADADSLAHLAMLWLLARRPGEAMRIYTRMLEKNPSDVRAGLGAAACDVEMMAYAKAEQRLSALRRRLPFDRRVYDQLHAIYRATGRSAEGERMRRIAQSIG